MLCSKLIKGLVLQSKVCAGSGRYLGSLKGASRAMTSGKTLDISGIYPPIATPFDQDENINWKQLEHNMNKWNEVPFRGMAIPSLVSQLI